MCAARVDEDAAPLEVFTRPVSCKAANCCELQSPGESANDDSKRLAISKLIHLHAWKPVEEDSVASGLLCGRCTDSRWGGGGVVKDGKLGRWHTQGWPRGEQAQ